VKSSQKVIFPKQKLNLSENKMHQQYLAQATSALNYMSSEELRELFSNDEKLDEQIDEIVNTKIFFVLM
jgi:hypothetical protein